MTSSTCSALMAGRVPRMEEDYRHRVCSTMARRPAIRPVGDTTIVHLVIETMVASRLISASSCGDRAAVRGSRAPGPARRVRCSVTPTRRFVPPELPDLRVIDSLTRFVGKSADRTTGQRPTLCYLMPGSAYPEHEVLKITTRWRNGAGLVADGDVPSPDQMAAATGGG